ncbi:hypothetical protein PV08_10056 [Exophiala spinifera]|uniref:Hemerythrin-like domain-containing protein n=1 Tax=Exophiala spinifera TaxID=91928 RepID=A0A0D1ZCJ1_9EURO|nr:uncharacterized protein PV08_10056 [Exophiala spinifera]KIW10757.1 hypothetical protein PV08_10056 [Exophiala spinifera]
MAATKSIYRVSIARSCCARPASLSSSIRPLYQSRFQTTVSPDIVNKLDETTARMSSANTGPVSDLIKHDHAELKEFYENVLRASDEDAKVRWQNQFTWELARHSIGEELVVYPAMENYMGEEGKRLADKDRAEHNEVKELLYKFQGLYPSDTDFEPTLKSLWNTLSQHIEEEETEDLPKLEDALRDYDPDYSAHLAKSFGRTKKFVPTRSHPAAPDKPPFETVVGLMTAPLDRLGDIFRRFPKD